MMESTAIAMPVKAATIGTHGYRIDGDVAVLNADLAADREAPSAEWALQLWACEEPHAGGRLAGTKVAEVGLDPSTMLPGTSQHVCAEVPLQLPATGRDYAMVLVLASGAPGAFEQVHDFSNFADRQPFVAPQLGGSVGYEIDGSNVELRADRVFNPRSVDNLSGTLALELRAFELPPTTSEAAGGGVSILLATAPLGCVAGQCALELVKEHASLSAPPPGQWRIVLALVEWTSWGFAQRDARAFEVPYRVAADDLPSSGDMPPAVEPAAAIAAMATVDAVDADDADGAAAIALEVVPPGERDHRVSIQTASVEDLSQVKCLNRKLAREIVKSRPFRSLDELLRVRGIGEKTLRKLRDLLTI